MFNNASYVLPCLRHNEFSFSRGRRHGSNSIGTECLDRGDDQYDRAGAGRDGRAFLAFKVTDPSAGVYHYEYAIITRILIAESNPSVYLWEADSP